MRLLLRCDASPAGGAGHLLRCVSLAEAARALGHDVLLAGATEAVAWVGVLLDELQVERVPAPAWEDFGRWLSRRDVAAVHVDAYDAPDDLRDRCAAAGVVLSSIEDGVWGRRSADVVLDPSIGAGERGRPDDGTAVALLGPRYAPVRAAVRTGRLAAAAREPGEVLDVVVVMGGTDATGSLAAALAAVAAAQRAERVPPLRVRAVAASIPAPEGLSLESLAPGPGLVPAMAEADLVVTAAGSTVAELWCLGVAGAAVPVAANQLAGYADAVDRRWLFGLGRRDRPGLGQRAVPVLAAAARSGVERRAVAGRAAEVVDGAGPARLLRAVERAVGAGAALPPPPLDARPACAADAVVLLDWRNDPQTRASSRAQDPIALTDHKAWLARVLAAPDRHLLVVQDRAAQPVGSVRWEADSWERTAWEVSIALAPHMRGRGWGGEVLRLGEARLLDGEPQARVLVAHVHGGNAASERLFHEAGYRLVPAEAVDGFRRWERLVR